MHLNVSAREYSTALTSILEPSIYEYVRKYNGSISAEHGIGQMKAKYMRNLSGKNDAVLRLMRRMKHLFDPNDIMNPGKMFMEEQ